MDGNINEINEIKVYKYRWVILFLFCLYSAINFLQFLQYSIISNIIEKYYKISSTTVNISGLVFMISFIALFLPVNYLIEKYNLKITALISCLLTTLGNLLKLLSVSPTRFYVAISGQLLCGIAQVFMISIPSKLASVWFGPNQVSTACAIAILGTQLGVALGCVIPTTFVKNHENVDDIGHDLFLMLLYNAAVTCCIFLAVLLFFRAKPDLPPSQSQLAIIQEDNQKILFVFKKIITNKSYLVLLGIFGVSNGIWNSFGLLVNSIYLKYFPGGEEDVGLIALISVIAGGCFGSLIFGFVLDKTHQFKLTSFSVLLAAALSVVLSFYCLETQSRIGSFITIPIFGFFISSTLVIGFEFATELTYPYSEAVSCSVLNVAIYIFGIFFTILFEFLFDLIGYLFTYIIVFVLLLLCSCSVYFIQPNLHRRQANIEN